MNKQVPPLVVILHGLNASPAWGFFPDLSRRLSEAGFASMRLALVHSLVSADVQHVHFALQPFDDFQVHFLGHSRGGAIAQIVAHERSRDHERVVVWSGIGRWLRSPIRTRTAYHDDLETHADRLSLTEASRGLGARVRYLHAAGDMVVKPSEITELVQHAGSIDRLTIFPGSTHTFGISHPMPAATDTYSQVVAATIRFLRR